MEMPPNDLTDVITDCCQLVDRVQLVNALDNLVVLRDEDGITIGLRGYHINTLGECSTAATVAMSEQTTKAMDRTVSGEGECRFMRNLTVSVGEPLTMLFRDRQSRKSTWITLGRITTIAICPPDRP